LVVVPDPCAGNRSTKRRGHAVATVHLKTHGIRLPESQGIRNYLNADRLSIGVNNDSPACAQHDMRIAGQSLADRQGLLPPKASEKALPAGVDYSNYSLE
jgi:hypothetical protein